MQEAIKISDNEISLNMIYYSKKVDGSPVPVNATVVPRTQIEIELNKLDEDIAKWQSIDARIYVADQIAQLQAQKARWGKIKQAIDGQIGESVIVADD